MRRDVYQAIADPTRRQIIALLSQHTLSLNGVAEHFSVSRPAISRHIKILRQCGLISIRQQGRERFCEVNLSPLRQVVEWAGQYQVPDPEHDSILHQLLGRELPQQQI